MTMLGRCRPLAVCLAIVLAVCFAVCLAAEAQRERPEERGRESEPEERSNPREEWQGFGEFARRHGGKDVREQEIPEIIELVRAWRMMKEVGLTEEESVKLLGLRREMREKRAELGEQRERARDELRKLVDDPQSTDDAIAKQLEALQKIEENRAALRRERTMPERLSVRQQAKLKLFRYHFNRHVRERLIQYIEERREERERRGDRDGRGRRDR